MRLLITDWDGTRYYENERGDIVDANGRLVDLTTENNIRRTLKMPPYLYSGAE